MAQVSVSVYHPLLLVYDVFVLTISTTFLWGCSAHKVLYPLFLAHFSEDHVDMGVGTGYFPARALSEMQEGANGDTGNRHLRENTQYGGRSNGADNDQNKRRILLWDLNTSCLARATSRIHTISPETAITTLQVDLTAPLSSPVHKMQSASALNVIHCLSGPTYEKCLALFRNAAMWLDSDGIFVGSTVMGPGSEQNRREANGMWRGVWGRVAWSVLWIYNAVGIFDNWGDGEEEVLRALEACFEEAEVWVVGRMALFRAFRPRGIL